MALQTGDAAPDFTLFTHDREPWTLADHRGTPVVLLFFPGAFTSVCTTELSDISNDFSPYESAGATVVGISTDSPFALAEFRRVNTIRFPLLSDHQGSVSEAYGAKYDHDFTPMKLDRISKRAAFVIDGEGVVRYAEVLENAGRMPDFEAVIAALSA